MGRAISRLIQAYQRWISPYLPPSCRFHPSCSEYVRLSFLKYPFFKAVGKSGLRILKCHPFHPGGVDHP